MMKSCFRIGAIICSSLFLSSCSVWPVKDHWAGTNKSGAVTAYEHTCGGRRHWNPVSGGHFSIIRDEKNGSLIWTYTQRVLKSVLIQPTPVIFYYENGQKVESKGTYRLRYMRRHPQEVYPWQVGYQISWNKSGTEAVVTKYKKIESSFWGSRNKKIESLNYKYPTVFKEITSNSTHNVEPIDDLDQVFLIIEGSAPLQNETFEVEVPAREIDGKNFDKEKTWFKYIDKWVFSPFNC